MQSYEWKSLIALIVLAFAMFSILASCQLPACTGESTQAEAVPVSKHIQLDGIDDFTGRKVWIEYVTGGILRNDSGTFEGYTDNDFYYLPDGKHYTKIIRREFVVSVEVKE